MAEQLAVLLRDGSHAGATNRFALKVEQLSIAIARTPMQIPVPSLSPEIFDIRMSRPTITISGLVDNTPQDASGNDDSNFWDMEYITISRYREHQSSFLDGAFVEALLAVFAFAFICLSERSCIHELLEDGIQ